METNITNYPVFPSHFGDQRPPSVPDNNPPYFANTNAQRANFKLYLPDGGIQYFTMEKPLTWNEFFSRCLLNTGLKKKECRLYYEDEEAEWIRISKEEEWKEFLMYHLNTFELVKFKVRHIKPQNTPKPNPNPQDSLVELIKMGFLDYKSREELLQLLKKHNGNVKKVIEIVLASPVTPQREQPFENKISPNSEFGYSEELSQLEGMGFDDKDLNLKLLRENDGKMDKVMGLLSSSKSPEETSYSVEEQITEPDYSKELIQLESMGFTDRELNLQLLRQYNGDIIAVGSALLSRRLSFQ